MRIFVTERKNNNSDILIVCGNETHQLQIADGEIINIADGEITDQNSREFWDWVKDSDWNWKEIQ